MIRKIVLVVAIMLVATGAFGAEIHGSFQFGFIPEAMSFETELNLSYQPWKWLVIYGGISVLMDSASGLLFNPYRDTYLIGTTFNLGPQWYIDLMHYCTHAVYSKNDNYFWDHFAGGNKTRLSVGIKW